MTIVYIAGPMTGLPNFNRDAFNKAAHDLRAVGAQVINPAALMLAPNASWTDYMRAALCNLSIADAVATLPGWDRSRGARLEVTIANALGMPVSHVEGFVRAEVAS